MIKDDEINLLLQLQKRSKTDPGAPYVRQLVRDLKMNEKRADYIFEKWTSKGWYEYGVSSLAGWLTPEGMKVEL